MRNIGLASIEAVRPQLGQNSNVPHKTSLHAKFQVISSIGAVVRHPPVRDSGLCSPPLLHEQRLRTWNMIFQPEIIPKYSLSFQILEFVGHIINNMNLPEYNIHLLASCRMRRGA